MIIMDHIHEWFWRYSLSKIKLDDSLFFDWFLKSLIPTIVKDITLEQPKMKEEAIILAQQYDLIYAQSTYLNFIILDTPCLGSSYPNQLRHLMPLMGL